jgi:hypothetical protein
VVQYVPKRPVLSNHPLGAAGLKAHAVPSGIGQITGHLPRPETLKQSLKEAGATELQELSTSGPGEAWEGGVEAGLC